MIALFLLAGLIAAPVERDIEAGKSHSYSVKLEQGQFLSATAEQLDGDVRLSLYDASGKRLAEVGRIPAGSMEELLWVASSSGDYTVDVSGKTKGRYRFHADIQFPSERDRIRAKAFYLSRVEGQALIEAKKMREASQKFSAAISEWRKSGDLIWLASDLNLYGATLFIARDEENARVAMDEAVDLLRTMPSERDIFISALGNLGMMCVRTGEFDRAAAMYEEVIRIREQGSDRSALGTVLNNSSIIYRRLGDYQKAEAALRRAVEIDSADKGSSSYANAIINLANLLTAAGDYQGALRQWSVILKEVSAERSYDVFKGMAGIYTELGDFASALQYLERAENIARTSTKYTQEHIASVLSARARVKFRQGEKTASLRLLEEALAIVRAKAPEPSAVGPLIGLCEVRREVGDQKGALAAIAEALAIIRKTNFKGVLPAALECEARARLHSGDLAASRALFEEALRVAEPRNRESILEGQARLERASGNLLAALTHIEEVIALRDRRARALTDPDTRTIVRARSGADYRMASELLMELHQQEPDAGYSARALETMERARARTLVEVLASGSQTLHPTRAQAEEEDRLLAAVSRAQRDLFQAGLTKQQKQERSAALASAERELTLFQNQLPSEFAPPDILNLRRIQKELLASEDSALLFYSIGREKSYLWTVTNRSVSAVPLPAEKEIGARVRGYRELLSKPPNALSARRSETEIATAGRALYQMLIAPAESAIAGKTRLIFVPDGVLHSLPFDALVNSTSALVERYRVSYAPSASALAGLQARGKASSGGMLLALADPSVNPVVGEQRDWALGATALPNARREVASIVRAIGADKTRVYEGPQARESVLKNERLSEFRYLHFAVHGYLDTERPGRSGLVLAQPAGDQEDGLLQAREIALMRFNADVVTLSACESGLGKVVDGEGVLGLSRAFLHAGAKSMVVSLWNVNDAATAELMTRFYTNLKAGQPGEEALRRAKLSLMRQGGLWRHPYYWAPFVFIGQQPSGSHPSISISVNSFEP